ncbi:hypothetical protein GCM10023091_31570 [Ravibacter arvi]|uniref:Secretion system C-terminal sorting domain-containing protein n=1 Tax=Ravibacter arvi TaxID=2051041 RepID=A0ABP8M695_9BACT
MKFFNSKLIISAFAVIIASQAAMFAADCDDAKNVLVNGSFERVSNGRLVGWTSESTGQRGASFTRESGYQVCGSYYGLITHQYGSFARLYQDVAIAEKASSVTLTMWGGVHELCRGEFRLIFLNGTGEIAGTRKVAEVKKRVPGLQKYTLTADIPASATKVRIEVAMNRTSNSNGIYLKMEAAKLEFEFSTSLPVTLAGFSAKSLENDVQLSWQTTSETNAAYFEVQHSRDAKSWSRIGEVKAQGSETGFFTYNQRHNLPEAGKNYYRLRMVDADQTFTFSKIEIVQFQPGGGSSVFIYPNPTRGEVKLYPRAVNFSVYNAAGRMVLETRSAGSESVDLGMLGEGNYLLRWSDHLNQSHSRSLVISK